MNLEKKKGAGIVSTLCAKMGATKKLGEISIPGNSTTTPGSQKSLAFPTFFGKQKILFFFCVCASGVVCVCRLAEFSLLFLFFFVLFLGWFVCFGIRTRSKTTRMSWLPALWLSYIFRGLLSFLHSGRGLMSYKTNAVVFWLFSYLNIEENSAVSLFFLWSCIAWLQHISTTIHGCTADGQGRCARFLLPIPPSLSFSLSLSPHTLFTLLYNKFWREFSNSGRLLAPPLTGQRRGKK